MQVRETHSDRAFDSDPDVPVDLYVERTFDGFDLAFVLLARSVSRQAKLSLAYFSSKRSVFHT
jgi:hypothetical protein